MALRLDVGAHTFLALCDDCPPWWSLSLMEAVAERAAIAHAWDVHPDTAAQLTSTLMQRRLRRRGRHAASRHAATT